MANEKEIKDLEKQVKEIKKQIKELVKEAVKVSKTNVNAFTHSPALSSMEKPLPEVEGTAARERDKKITEISKQIGQLETKKQDLNRQIDELSLPVPVEQMNLKEVNAEIERLDKRYRELSDNYTQFPNSVLPKQLEEVKKVNDAEKSKICDRLVPLYERRTDLENQINTIKAQIENNKNSIRSMREVEDRYLLPELGSLKTSVGHYNDMKRQGLTTEDIGKFDNVSTQRKSITSFEDRISKREELKADNKDLKKKIKELEGR